MNYYCRFPGDYASDTHTLTAREDGMYGRLLDYQYSTEKPIRDIRHANQICRSGQCSNELRSDQRAVKFILETYFVLEGDGYWNKRVKKEIARAESKRQNARAAANSRHERDKNATKTRQEHDINATQTRHENTHNSRIFNETSLQSHSERIAIPHSTLHTPQKEESKEGAPAPPSLAFAGHHFSVTVKQDALLGEGFPWIDRAGEYRKADSWMEANPERRPRKANRFLHNWFSRITQSKGKFDGKDINSAVETTMRGYAKNSGIN